jgi:hypothetical protein
LRPEDASLEALFGGANDLNAALDLIPPIAGKQ